MNLGIPPLGGEVAVRRVRCRTRAPAAGIRHRLLDALDHLDDETGLPPAAILVVRRLEGAVAGAPARVIGVELRETARRAHRAGSAPLDCDAVLFGDEAELLTTLARDVAAGRSLGWWWGVLLRRGTPSSSAATAISPTAAVAAAFTQFARALPAVAVRAPSLVRDAAVVLPPAEVLRILGLIAESHAAPSLVDVARRAAQALGAPTSGDTGAPVDAATDDSPRSARTAGRLADFGTGVGDPGRSHGGLPRALAALLAETAAQLHRDPVAARTPARADEVERALAAALHQPAPDRARPPRVGRVWAGTEDGRPIATDAPVESRVPPPRAGVAEATTASTTASSTGAAVDAELDETIDERTTEPRRVRTRLGGAFYLLNLLEWLDLPASADGPDEPGPALNRWGVLLAALTALAGRPDLPERPPRDPADPLFDLFDELAGLRREPSPRWAYRCPPIVLPSPGAGSGAPRWWCTGERVVVGLGALVLADVSLTDESGNPRYPETVALREQAVASLAGSPIALSAPPDPATTAPLVGSWGERVGELLRALLARVHLDASVLRVPATVEVSDVTVRVVMRLDDVDLGVRRAGLDRSPGWVPELGRVVDLGFV